MPDLLSGTKNTPKLIVKSGDTVDVEMVTHHAGDYYDGAFDRTDKDARIQHAV